jgi:hypothetical protein
MYVSDTRFQRDMSFSNSAAFAISFKFLNSVLPVALHNYFVSLANGSLVEQTYGIEL